MDKVFVTVIKNPFDPHGSQVRKYVDHVPGKTVDEYLTEFYPLICPDTEIVASRNGGTLDDSSSVVAKPGDSLVLCPVFHGGGGGGKNPLKIIAQLAVVIIATWASYGTATAPTIAAMGAGQAAAIGAGVGAAITMAGGIIINAVFPTTATTVSSASDMADSSSTYSWGREGNAYEEGTTVPVLYGKMRVTPVVLSSYTRSTNDQQYLSILYLVSEGLINSISDIEINDNTYTNYDSISIEKRLGNNDQEAISFFGDTYSDSSVSSKLSTDLSWTTTTTPGDSADGLVVVMSCPSGLWYAADSGGLETVAVSIEVQSRRYDEDTATWEDWVSWGTYSISGSDYSTIRKTIRKDNLTQGKYEIRTRYVSTPLTGSRYGSDTYLDYIQEVFYDDFTYPNTALLGIEALATDQLSGSMPTVTCIGDRQYIGEEVNLLCDYIHDKWYSASTSGTSEVFIKYTNIINPKYAGEYTVSFEAYKTSNVSSCELFVLPNSYTTVGIPCHETVPITTSVTSFTYTFTLTQDHIDAGFGFIRFDNHGSDDGTASTLYVRNVKLEKGSSVTITKPASNPAWACWDMLVNTISGLAIPESKLIYDEFEEWAEWCDEKGIYCGLYCDTTMSAPSAISMLSQLGRGRVIQRGNKYGVIVDKPSDPVQMFTVGNIVANSFEETWLGLEDRANVISIEYWDEDDDYTRKTFQTRTDSYNSDLTDIETTVTLTGCTNKTIAYNHAKYLLNCNTYLLRTVSITAQVDAIACQPGDVILIQHDVPEWGYGGRVQNYNSSTGEITIDREVYMPNSAGNYHIMLRHSVDDSIEELTLENGNDTTDTVIAYGSWSIDPEPGDIYSVGEVGIVTKPFRVISISKSSDLECKISCLEYYGEIYEDEGDVPDVTQYSMLTSTSNLKGKTTVRTLEGLDKNVLCLSWSGAALKWTVYKRLLGTSTWECLGTTSSPRFDVFNLQDYRYYELCVSSTGSPNGGKTVIVNFPGDATAAGLENVYMNDGVTIVTTNAFDNIHIIGD